MLIRGSYNLKRIYRETSTEFPLRYRSVNSARSIFDTGNSTLNLSKSGLFKYLSIPFFFEKTMILNR